MKRQVRRKGASLHIEGEMTVYTAATLHEEVRGRFAERAGTKLIDLSGVTEIDTAGVQILFVARRCASERGDELQIVNPSPAVSDVLDLLQLGARL
jgi:anti-sigma B factor antagonist